MDYYTQIFKRKSFHIFKSTDTLSGDEIQELKDFIKNVKPLDSEIKTEICIVPEKESTCKRGGEFCILFYSETKDEYLQNIGYIGEQIDLYLASKNIGALLQYKIIEHLLRPSVYIIQIGIEFTFGLQSVIGGFSARFKII